MKKAVIFAPFWRQAGHVGNNRVDRFVRWLAEDGFHVVMIRAGSVDGRREEPWGTEITVRDPMGLYRDASPTGIEPSARKPNKLRRALSYWLFNPDPSVVWARVVARHHKVLEAAAGAAFILSSSPPESAHVGAWKLSRRLGIPHVVDMRDGWLDEPLKPLLRTSAFKRWQEARLEARILREAGAIFVTSEVWQVLLNKRLPTLTKKVSVLTNGYPPSMKKWMRIEKNQNEAGLMLVHTGRFSGSDTRRTPDLILQPLLEGVRYKASQGTIKLVGSLSADELEVIGRFAAPFAEYGWRIECPSSLPRHELLQLLPQANGLLLLSASRAAIPSKLFEYIPTGRPILVVTEKDSATWRICAALQQATLIDIANDSDINSALEQFISNASSPELNSDMPDEFGEARLREVFLQHVPRK